MAHQLELASDAPAAGGAEGVHRLRDILVEEVSLVDRAANKRRFLIIKRSGGMTDAEKELAADGRGGLTAADDVAKAKEPPAGGAVGGPNGEGAAGGDTEKAGASAPGDDGEGDRSKDGKPADGARRRKAGHLAIPGPVKEAVLRIVTEALERLMSVANSVKEAQETDEQIAAPVPDEVTTELQAISDILLGIADRYPSPQSKGAVAKAGARMAKDRLERFQKALALLAELLKELTEMKEAPPTGPSAGAAEAGVRKADAPLQAPGVAQLVAGVTELTRVVKRQEEELIRLREARGVSNAIPVDAARRAAPQDVSWPLDMNRPISRDQVKKEVSFFED